jgi:hypothetical protein
VIGSGKIRTILVGAIVVLIGAGLAAVASMPSIAEIETRAAASKHHPQNEGLIRSSVKELTQNRDRDIQNAVNACARAWVALKVDIPGAGAMLAALQGNDEAKVRSLIIELHVYASKEDKKLLKLFLSVPECSILTAKLWWQPKQLVDEEIPTTCGEGYRRVFDRRGRPMAICVQMATSGETANCEVTVIRPSRPGMIRRAIQVVVPLAATQASASRLPIRASISKPCESSPMWPGRVSDLGVT